MGRTVTPYSMQIEMVRARFKDFRKALRKEDQEFFDELFRYAKINVQAGVMAASPNPADSIFMAILIEVKRDMKEQDERIRALEEKINLLQGKAV